MVDVLQAAVVRRRKVRLSYTNNSRELSERLIDPWGLIDKDDRRRDASPVLQGGVSPGPAVRPGAAAALLLDDRQRSAAARGGGNLVRAARVFSVECRHRVR